MKKMIFGLIALVFAIGAVAFTQPEVKKDKKFVSYFWEYNAAGTALILSTSVPPTSLPVSCPNPQQKNCAAEYPSYSTDPVTGEQIPSGTLIKLYKKPN